VSIENPQMKHKSTLGKYTDPTEIKHVV